MKYHATFSTIVISIIVLLLFTSVAVFTVYSLNILSPGFMISGYLLSKIPSLEPYELSYKDITNLHNGITVENIDIGLNGETFLHLDSVKVSASVFQLVKGYLSKDMDLDVKIQGLEADVDFDFKELTLPNILKSKESVDADEKKEKEPLKLRLKLATDNAHIKYLDLFELTGLTFNATIEPGFKIKDVQLQLDKLVASYNGIYGEAEDFRLDLKQNKLSDIDLSVEKAKVEDGFILDITSLSLSTELKSFKDIDIFSLPISLSLKALNLDYDDIFITSSDVSLSYKDKNVSLYFGTLDGKYKGYSISTDSLPLVAELKDDSVSVISYNSLNLGIKGKDFVKIGQLSADGSKRNGEYLLLLNKLDLDILNVKENINGYLESASLDNINMAVKYNKDKEISLDGSVDINIDTVFNSIKNINVPLSLSTQIDNEFKVKDVSVYSSKIKLFEGEPIKLSFDLKDNDNFSISLQKGNELKVNGSFDKALSLRLEATNYHISQFNELVKEFVPALQSYIGEGTKVTSVIDFNYDRESKEGDTNSLITISDIRFNKYEFSLSTNLDAHISDNIIDLKRLVLTSSFLRAEYKGLLDIKTLKPQGALTLSLPDSATPLLELSFSPEGDNSYSYKGTIPYLQTGDMKGEVSYFDDKVTTLFSLNFVNRSYPFSVDWNFMNKNLSILSDGLNANVDYKDLLVDVDVDIDSFPVGRKTNTPDTLISGNFNFQFDIPAQKFDFSLPNLKVGAFYSLENEPSLFINLAGDNEKIEFKQFDFISSVDSFKGFGGFDIYDKKGAFTIGNEDASIDITFTPFEQYYTGIVDIKNLSLATIGIPEERLNVSLIGRGKDLNNFEFSGNLDIVPIEGAATPWNMTSSILINKDEIALFNSKYTKGAINVDDIALLLDIKNGKYSLGSKLDLTFEVADGKKTILTEATLNAELGTFESWFKAGRELASRYNDGNIAASLKIPYLIFDNEVVATDRVINISKDLDGISFTGNTLNGDISLYDLTGKLDIFGLDNILKGNVKGIFDPTDMDLEVNIDKFNLYYLNVFFPPIFKFLPDSISYGSVKVMGNLFENDFHLYGDVFGYELGMDVWWVRKQDIILTHPTFHIWDNVITSANLPIITINRETKEKNVQNGTLELSMQNSFLDYFTLDVYCDENNPVYVRIPLLSANVDMDAWVNGHFRYEVTDLGRIKLSGDLNLNDGQVSIGLNPLPEWWDPHQKVINEYTCTIGKNVRFIFPLSSSPILSADLQNDTSFTFYSNMLTNKISVGGEILIKSGQIYYFSKNFFITEGAIDLNGLRSDGKLNPKISLRARLRDFDSNNEKVDIYLVLNNSTLDNINPSFESSPQKTNNEIMSILGNAILPSDGGMGNINTVASLVTSSVDILSRLGLMSNQGGDLSQSIKNALHLDMFTINSQIIENFLIDSVSATTSNASALSRYLNNTSIYLGKNLSDNFFLQGIIHFASVKSNESSTFFASDLAINTELSLEWTNPLGTVTFFTHPESLTLYDTVRNFGFTYTKRLTL